MFQRKQVDKRDKVAIFLIAYGDAKEKNRDSQKYFTAA